MSMALKKDVYKAKALCGDIKPIDLAHLSKQTMGDDKLESEILGIFVKQAEVLVELISSSDDPITISNAVHSLKGASRGIGAFKLADIAQEVEYSKATTTTLKEVMIETSSYINEIYQVQ